jgi:tetratricopeptide (TPR) repeat protein
MSESPSIYTVTMARVLEDQGKYSEALKIYHQLLSIEPLRPDLLSALNRLEARLGRPSRKRLINLFEDWVDLLLIQDRIQLLKLLKRG